MSAFLLSIASGVITALVLLAGREIRRVAKTVTDSAAAVSSVAGQVATLAGHDAENRERIAALWARVFPDPTPPWSANGNPSPGRRTR